VRGRRIGAVGAEHLEIKALISNLQYDIEKTDPQWLETMRRLQDLVLTHAQEEEDGALLSLHSGLSEEENASLTRRIHWEGIKVA
jgi:hypothetical protein